MKPRDVLKLVHLRKFERSRTQRMLNQVVLADDFRAIARRRLPRAVFDYVDGGADEEITMRSNREAFARRRFHPRLLRDVSVVPLTGEIFGQPFRRPIGLSPTGYTRMMHPTGEISACRAAMAAGIPYTLSTVGTTTIEDVAATGHPNLWFQLYITSDHRLSDPLVDRAAAAGYKALEVTIDTAVTGRRARDARNGLSIPPELSLRTIFDIGRRPRFWMRMLTSPAIEFSNLNALTDDEVASASTTTVGGLFDDTLNWSHISELRARWQGPLLLKGPIGPEDALRAIDLGVDGFHLSNHGGRQLDRCVPSADLIAPLRAAVGPDVPIVVDSGVHTGGDVAVALALGADMAFIGRAYVYAVAAAGERGVSHLLQLMTAELRSVMQLSGVSSIAQLRKEGLELLAETVKGSPAN